jgi:hypothetical protein
MNAFSRKNSTLEPAMVAKAVVSQILKAESAQLVLPERFSILSALRGVFNWFEEDPRDGREERLPDFIEYHLSLSGE